MSTPARPIFEFGPFRLDPNEQRLLRNGEPVALTPKAFELLLCLVKRHGELLTKEELLAAVWPDTFVEEAVLSVNISTVRKALGDDQNGHSFIETAPRRGYRFLASVETVRQAVSAEEPVQRNFSTVAQPVGRIHGFPLQKRWGIVLSVGAFLVVLWGFNVTSLRNRLLSFVGAPRSVSAFKIESLAVLPLANLSGDPNQDYFADGMTEELITTLSKISALKTISRTSVMQYKGVKKPLPEIARELGVDGIIEGSVLRSGDRVRITAQLINVSTDTHLWGDTFDRDLRDVLTLQSDVARTIAQEVRVAITPAEQRELAAVGPVDPEAHELYLMGRYHWWKRTAPDMAKAIQAFKQAIAKDPNYAAAYAGLADAYSISADNGFQPGEVGKAEARAAALKAVALDDSLAEAHVALGNVYVNYDWDWARGEAEFRRAIALNPNSAIAYLAYAAHLSTVRRNHEAIAAGLRARQLDPLATRINAILAAIYYCARRYDEAIAASKKGLEIDANDGMSHLILGESYLQKGMSAQAVADLQELRARGDIDMSALVVAYLAAGRRADARRLLAELMAESKRRYIPAYNLAEAHVGLASNDQIFAWLEKAYEERDPAFPWSTADPVWDRLRPDPRFQDLLRRIGLPH